MIFTQHKCSWYNFVWDIVADNIEFEEWNMNRNFWMWYHLEFPMTGMVPSTWAKVELKRKGKKFSKTTIHSAVWSHRQILLWTGCVVLNVVDEENVLSKCISFTDYILYYFIKFISLDSIESYSFIHFSSR